MLAPQAISQVSTGSSTASSSNSAVLYLREQYEAVRKLFQCQPAMVQRFFEGQAKQVGEMFVEGASQINFSLPDQVLFVDDSSSEPKILTVSSRFRHQSVGNLFGQIAHPGARENLLSHLLGLEKSRDAAVATSASLIRYAAARYLVHDRLPSGRSVTYRALEGEEIPTIPTGETDLRSSMTSAGDAIVEESQRRVVEHLQVPYVPTARRFYLPQWVIFDDEGNLLANTIQEAEASLASMQRFLTILQDAALLAPYIVVDEDYQQKRYGMLGQLVNQGRALACYQTQYIIETIRRRSAAKDLNQGLTIRLPYFDDQALEMKLYSIDVIPVGRVMYIPAFVVLAVREHMARVAKMTRIGASTRKYLLNELMTLERAFYTPCGAESQA